ncbi:MAG: hypothetical protein KAQ94_01610 [Arcobacteraceae bacterium]|nr:hypothetical protein [Arcobacteraceae bacterium]
MILIGDENIPYENIEKINNIEDIKNTKPNSTVLFNFDIEILKYTKLHDINSAVIANDIKEVIYASSMDAKYIIPIGDIVIQTQKIADNYMFDSKILAVIDNSNEIVEMALKEIDGIVYRYILNE